MAKVARLNDVSNHGGVIITSCSKTNADGKLIARQGDLHACPIEGHGVTPIVSNVSEKTNVEGAKAAKIGSVCGCGAVIISGAPKTEVD